MKTSMYDAFVEEIKFFIQDSEEEYDITEYDINDIAYRIIYDEYLWEQINNIIKNELENYKKGEKNNEN